MDRLNKIWDFSFLGNDVGAYATAFGIFIGGFIVVAILKSVILRRLQAWAARTKTAFDDLLLSTLKKTLIPLLYYGIVYLSLTSLDLNPSFRKILVMVGQVLVMVASVRFILQAIRFGIFKFWLPSRSDAIDIERQFRGLMPIVTVVVWGLGVVFLLDNLGFKVSAIVAGLGIGGVALALASQTVLGDMFSYFAIMLDRPFEIDDFIIAGDFKGTVENVGIKTTRLRSLSGEQVVFSNKDLTDSRIRNYKRMEIRRIEFKLGITYDTSLEKLKKAVALVKDIITRTPETRFDRAHFSSYGDFNLVIEVVYFVLSADFNKYMDIQQAINFAIKEAFEKEQIEFAFPTQTLYLSRSAKPLPNSKAELQPR